MSVNFKVVPDEEKLVPEKDFRRKLLNTARHYGCDIEIKQIIDRYDRLLKNCSDPTERKQIGTMGIAEIHKYLGCRAALIVNGEMVLPGEEVDPDQLNPLKNF